MTVKAFPRHVAMATLAGAVFLGGGPVAQAATCSTEEQAIDQFRNLMQSAMQRMQADNAPDELRKDKIGLVLVARPSVARTTDQDALRREINVLSQQLGRSPRDVCRAVESIRRAHGL